MATAINAVDVVVKVEDIVVGCLSSFDFTIERALDSAACAASGGWSEVSPGRKSASGTLNGVYREFTSAEQAANFGYDDLFDLIDEGTKVGISYGTLNSGQRRYNVSGFLGNVQFSQPESGSVTWSANFTASGPVTPTTNPA